VGTVTIREVVLTQGNDLNKILHTIKYSKEWIECMAYSPSGDKLAVGSHDNLIIIYNV
jgi:WD40 repeat protein